MTDLQLSPPMDINDANLGTIPPPVDMKRKMVADNADDDQIADVDEEIEDYKKMKKNLNKKLFDASK